MQKNVADNGKDILSTLPDDLLGYILSFLPTTEAIGTSCLSLRWRNLWKFLQGLEISLKEETPMDLAASNIFKLVSEMKSSKLFKLQFKGLSPYKSGVSNIMARKFDDDVDFVFDGYKLTCHIKKSFVATFQIKDIVKLQLQKLSCEVALCSSYRLSLLQTLVLDSVYTSREAVEDIICKSPLLQILYLNVVCVDNEIRINHSKLRLLVVWSCVVVELRVPAVTYLELDSACLVQRRCDETERGIPADFPSLAMFVIHSSGQSACFIFPLPNLWKMMINDTRHVKTLHLDRKCIKGLSMGSLPSEKNLDCSSIFIKITILRKPEDVDALAKILRAFPAIEKVTLVLEEFRNKSHGFSEKLEPLVQVVSGFQQLKEVDVHGFHFSQDNEDHPDAGSTLMKLLAEKLQKSVKTTFELSKDKHKFKEILEKFIVKDFRNHRISGGLASVGDPRSMLDETTLTLYKI